MPSRLASRALHGSLGLSLSKEERRNLVLGMDNFRAAPGKLGETEWAFGWWE